ncbi:hypothetical protein IV203_030298 [Nitzschia inconspicua]|uniref:Uncharacterized protein n=1 Tax=Nitzschia inconspicua TaxID=303405 RepID=A0A9K3LT21_9STRA|nr:hypothetical protein IV203_030298 [Nitzschia inconspicua]
MTNQSFEYFSFKLRVLEALEEVSRILNLDRNPRLAGDVGHEYADKYALANTLTNTAIIAQMNVLDRLGLTNDILKKIDLTKATTLRFQAFDSCEFIKEQVVDVPVPIALKTTEETTTTGEFKGNTTKSSVQEVVNRIKEFHWKVDVKWEISVYSGTNVDKRIVLDSRSSSTTLIVQSSNRQFPLPNHREHAPIEVPLTWLLKQIDIEVSKVHFTINTQEKDAKTPCRNKQVEDALNFHEELYYWMRTVYHRLAHQYRHEIIERHNPATPSPSTSNISNSQDLRKLHPVLFVPILPLMEEVDGDQKMPFNEVVEQPSSNSALGFLMDSANESDPSKTTRVLTGNDMTLLLNEHVQSLDKARESIRKGFPVRQSDSLISEAEAEICILSDHSLKLVEAFKNGIRYIEKMLEDQLVSAIGKKVTSLDLDQFVRYHNGKMLNPPPKQFCHAIRRPNHYPEGVLSIESDRTADEKSEPIETHVRRIDVLAPLKIPLNAATTIELTGETYLHGWLNHRFSTESTTFQLIGRARQFSSFMLVVGTMIGPDCMQPKDAIIIQNKDEVKIPLLLNEIPTAKEFKDAINSLSPEQQRFAKAYRSMQLQSSILGICIIQIKPQLEDVLGLPHDSLTKEMQLTQDLVELFIEYQVPSDMMSYDEENQDVTTKEKVDVVKEHVKAVLDVIQDSKKKQLKEQEMKTDMALEKMYSFSQMDWAGSCSMDEDEDSESEESCSTDEDETSCSSDEVVELKRRERSCRKELRRRVRSFRKRQLKEMSSNSPQMDKLRCKSCAQPDESTEYPRQEVLSTSSTVTNNDIISAYSKVMERTDCELLRSCAEPDARAEYPLREVLSKSTETNNDKISADTFPNEPKCGRTKDVSSINSLDFTGIPKLLDGAIEKYNSDSTLRTTTITTGNTWKRDRQENLLSPPYVSTLSNDEIKTEKNKAFDLLDALSRSGSLPIQYSELHVVVCVTHCFDKNVMDTIIQDNVNPIEKLEWSTLLLASTIHGVPARTLLTHESDRMRSGVSFPALVESEEEPEN